MNWPFILCGISDSILVWMNSYRLYASSQQHFRLLSDAVPQEWLLTHSSLGWELDLGEKLVMNLYLKKGKMIELHPKAMPRLLYNFLLKV